MKNTFLFYLLISLSFYCYPQEILNNSIRDVEHLLATGRSLNKDVSKYADVKGTPYLTKDFFSAQILPGEKYYWVKYNVYEDLMEVKLDDTRTIVLDNTNVSYKIKPKSSSYSYVYLKGVGKTESGYFLEIVTTNTTSLYKKFTKKLTPAREPLNPYDKAKQASFSKEKTSFYIQFERGGELQEIPSKQKAFWPLLTKHQDVIKEYIKKNKIKLTKENDLIQLIHFISSLEN